MNRMVKLKTKNAENREKKKEVKSEKNLKKAEQFKHSMQE